MVDADYLSDEDYQAEVQIQQGICSDSICSPIASSTTSTTSLTTTASSVTVIQGPDHAPAEESRPDGEFNSDVRTYYTDQEPGRTTASRSTSTRSRCAPSCRLPGAHQPGLLANGKIGVIARCALSMRTAPAATCRAETRKIDRVTEEFKASIDGHLGYVDLEAIGLYREFKDREPIPMTYLESTSPGRGRPGLRLLRSC